MLSTLRLGKREGEEGIGEQGDLHWVSRIWLFDPPVWSTWPNLTFWALLTAYHRTGSWEYSIWIIHESWLSGHKLWQIRGGLEVWPKLLNNLPELDSLHGGSENVGLTPIYDNVNRKKWLAIAAFSGIQFVDKSTSQNVILVCFLMILEMWAPRYRSIRLCRPSGKTLRQGLTESFRPTGVFLKWWISKTMGFTTKMMCNMCNFGWADSPYIDHPCDFHGVYPLKLHPRCRVESSWICSTLLVCASGKSISVARTGALSLEKTPEQYADSLSNMRGSTGSIHRIVIFNWWVYIFCSPMNLRTKLGVHWSCVEDGNGGGRIQQVVIEHRIEQRLRKRHQNHQNQHREHVDAVWNDTRFPRWQCTSEHYRRTRCCPSTSRTIPPTSGNKHDAFNHCFFASSCGAMFSRRGATAAAKATATPSGSEAKGGGAAASPDPQPGARGAGGGWCLMGHFEIFWGCAWLCHFWRKHEKAKLRKENHEFWEQLVWTPLKAKWPTKLGFWAEHRTPKTFKIRGRWSQPADSCRKSDSWYSLIAGKECGQTRETHLTIFCIQVGWVCPSSPNLCDGSDGSCFWHSFNVMRKEARGAWERREEEAETWLEYVRIIQYYML